MRATPRGGAQRRWQESGEIPAAGVEILLLRAVELCTASVNAARDVFESTRGLIVCTVQSTQITDEEVTRDYDRWVARAGVPRIRMHDQRHTNA